MSMACTAFATASSTTPVLFHCPTSCKIYIDGKLELSLPNGGLKQTNMPTGIKATVLISRPGKADWVHIVTPTKALSINPSEPSPTEIRDDGADSAGNPAAVDSSDKQTTSANTKIDQSSQSRITLPSWAKSYLYMTPDTIETKRVQIKKGSHSCPEDVRIDVTLELLREDEAGKGNIEYNQTMSSAFINETNWCDANNDAPEFNQNFSFKVPITLSKTSEDVLAFTADMQHCSECNLPPGVSQIVGQVRRGDGEQVNLEFGEPLNTSFLLEVFHSRK
jgi:hypothetical protein